MYRVRMTAPVKTDFVEVYGSDEGDAASNFMSSRLDQTLFVKPENYDSESGETAHFALVEVEGCGEMCVRYFYSGFGRHGGVQVSSSRERVSLESVEQAFGLAPGHLSQSEWAGEESAEEAWNRKFNS